MSNNNQTQQRVCIVCGNPLPPRRKKYCSDECSRSSEQARAAAQYTPISGNQGIYRKSIVCVECGTSFAGHIKSNRCPECRAAKRRRDTAEYKRRAAAGKIRPIGSTDFCARCGQPYIVCGPLQRYCKTCAPDAVRANMRAQSRAWNNEYYSDDEHRTAKNFAQAIKSYQTYTCQVCGKQFTSDKYSLTCSQGCRKQYKKAYLKAYDAARAEARKSYNHDRNQAVMADPDKRDEKNRKARAAYARRKAAQKKETSTT